MCGCFENRAYSYIYTEGFLCNKTKKRGVAIEYGANFTIKYKKTDKSIRHLKTNS